MYQRSVIYDYLRHLRRVFVVLFFFFFQAEDGIRDLTVTGVQTCALPLPIGGISLAMLLAATTVAAQDYDAAHIPALRCESQFNKTEQCPIEGPMRLARQLSVTRCVENQNWGQSRRMLWVTDGCRAEFVA